MSDTKKKPDAPKNIRRRRKTRMEDHPDVQKWCADFVQRTEDEQGYTPTTDQAIQAFLVAALRAIGACGAQKEGA